MPEPIALSRAALARAPRHLSTEARSLFRSITAAYLMEPHDLAVLVVGLEALDRANAARRAIDADGLTVLDRFGQARPHPLLTAEVQARSQFLAGMKQLGLDYEPVSNQARTVAARAARWSR